MLHHGDGIAGSTCPLSCVKSISTPAGCGPVVCSSRMSLLKPIVVLMVRLFLL
jgi:hypothetical protein